MRADTPRGMARFAEMTVSNLRIGGIEDHG
jgi:hypothetical protein